MIFKRGWLRGGGVGFRHLQLIRNLPLPKLGAAIPMVGFFFVVPVLLVFVYLFFHLALQRLGETLAELPVMFPDGRREKRLAPGGSLASSPGSCRNRRAAGARWRSSRARFPVSSPIGFRPRRWWSSGRAIWCCRMYAPRSCTFFCWLARPPLRFTSGATPKPAKLRRGVRAGLAGSAARRFLCAFLLVSAVLLAVVWIGTIYGAPHDPKRAQQFSGASLHRWAADTVWAFGFDPFAHLTESDLSVRPKGWTGSEEQRVLVKGANLNKSNLRYAEAYRSFWVNAHCGKRIFRVLRSPNPIFAAPTCAKPTCHQRAWIAAIFRSCQPAKRRSDARQSVGS